jgi:hypothetical protein
MGTNFYARIIPKEEDKQKLIDAINDEYYDFESDGLRFSTSINFS